MKTELEWFKPEDRLPEDGRGVIVCFIDSDGDNGFSEASFYENEKYFETPFFDTFSFEFGYWNNEEKENEKITHWAYVNLPEENEVYEITCDECKKVIGEANKKPHAQNFKDLCKECREKEEEAKKIRNECCKLKSQCVCLVNKEEDWIWPLKQLPEEGQEVEIKFSHWCEDQEIPANAIFKKNRFLGREYGEKLINIIAWRPLNEKNLHSKCSSKDCAFNEEHLKNILKKTEEGNNVVFCGECLEIGNYNLLVDMSRKKYLTEKAEKEYYAGFSSKKERKPDLSKLKEGDLIMVYFNDGRKYYGEYNFLGKKDDLLHLIGFNFFFNLKSIKKIIRINIDETVDAFVPRLGELMPAKTFTFEEI